MRDACAPRKFAREIVLAADIGRGLGGSKRPIAAAIALPAHQAERGSFTRATNTAERLNHRAAIANASA
jgi:hypothetical protein